MSSHDDTGNADDSPEVTALLQDPTASYWLKAALRSALAREPVDVANDAEVLSALLARRCQRKLSCSGRSITSRD